MKCETCQWLVIPKELIGTQTGLCWKSAEPRKPKRVDGTCKLYKLGCMDNVKANRERLK